MGVGVEAPAMIASLVLVYLLALAGWALVEWWSHRW